MFQQCHTYILQYSTFASGRPQVRKWGRQTCFLPRATSNLVTHLSIWRFVPSRNSSTHLYAAKLRCRQTADSRTALAIALKLFFRFHFGRLQNLESVISFPYCIPILLLPFLFLSRWSSGIKEINLYKNRPSSFSTAACRELRWSNATVFAKAGQFSRGNEITKQ